MAYNEKLAGRIREILALRSGLDETKMFGGLSFTLGGNMCFGVIKDDLVVRVGPDSYEIALSRPHARPMDFTGRPMRGMVYVGPDGYKTDEELKYWLDQGLSFAASLPPKTPPKTRNQPAPGVRSG